jgi:hypothetical protein
MPPSIQAGAGGAVEGFIDGILEADQQAPRKQRHTARRIYRRILAEMPDHTVAESTVRNYVRDRKRALGLLIQEIYVAQSYSWGGEAQWYEAYAEQGRRMKSSSQKSEHVLVIPGGLLATRPHADPGCSVPAHEVDGDLAQDGQIASCRSIADAAVVLTECLDRGCY